jgi:predicted secreted hydrolase
MRRAVAWLLLAALWGCAPDDGPPPGGDFAVLAQGAEGFEQASPGVALEFPRDHGAHPGYRIEWWYLTANLQDASGRPYGAQWTLFRTATKPPGAAALANAWQDPQVYMAHMAITTPDGHVSFQRYARGGEHDGLAQAGASASPFRAWLDDWTLQSMTAQWLPLELWARQGNHGIELRLDSEGPLVLQGQDGFSQKHPSGGGSYYYSQPFLAAAGVLEVDGERIPITGQAWLDREWSSQFLQADQAGWDWFALHLDSGEKLMLFRLRGQADDADYRHGVLIAPDGATTALPPAEIGMDVLQTTTVAGRDLPLHWRIRLPTIGRDLEVKALHPRQWMEVDFAYWEGVVLATGAGPGNSGRGYLELTGYPR